MKSEPLCISPGIILNYILPRPAYSTLQPEASLHWSFESGSVSDLSSAKPQGLQYEILSLRLKTLLGVMVLGGKF